MEMYTIVLLVAIVLILVSAVLMPGRKKSDAYVKKKAYSYTARSNVMTPAESLFFEKLSSIAEGKYLVFPQIHLSTFIDHKITGQNWEAAFRHINGKSVDYLLCDIDTLQPRYAVELDDYTHERDDRRERDVEVERILEQAGVPLVRFANNQISGDDIIQQFSEVQRQTR